MEQTKLIRFFSHYFYRILQYLERLMKEKRSYLDKEFDSHKSQIMLGSSLWNI